MHAPVETSRVLVAVHEAVAAAEEGQVGALWRLAERGRQLDANLVRLSAGAAVAEHVESELDVLLVVVEGGGHLDNGVERQAMEPGSVAWLPRTARRALLAGPNGLAYLSVHQRRPGLRIGFRTADTEADGDEGGEAPCSLDRVCPACGRLAGETDARYCARCGEELPIRGAL
ncbi:hypothetical protein [Streptomyces sp. BPTC-684]|uniref:hypothetical protein n=1 Tax=Streptomyces sp. BPTC-684 TaxID=3043734 RepID=UPI0024B2347F|nr:hypothetical protein [Streptomyces sp. BPTC-684]WHM40525.1 hypothetical protein QIY60_29105 [Streptomyces sp. BPTC-684]